MNRLLKFLALFSWLSAGGMSLAARRDSDATPADEPQPPPSVVWIWKHKLLLLAALLILLPLGGFLVAASGIMPIKASSGHWPITAWLLEFSMSRSVSTHTLGMEAPPLDDPALVLRGATHYEIGCRPCHGSPVLHQPRIALHMTPHPPYLPPAIHEWTPEELFYIVKHGVKFTGMPAWPTQQRDDEVWAMTAFLLKFPELDTAAYERLVNGDVTPREAATPLHDMLGPGAVPQVVTDVCARCHGVEGQGRGIGAFPHLAGQQREYLAASLQAYAEGTRHSGIMEPIAAPLSRAQINAIADYYSRRDPAEPALVAPDLSASIQRGENIAQQGIPSKRVPACIACHGRDDAPANPVFPVLAGQDADYLVLQLELFQKQHRGGTEYAHLMHPVAAGLEPDQRRDVAHYYESLKRTAE